MRGEEGCGVVAERGRAVVEERRVADENGSRVEGEEGQGRINLRAHWARAPRL